MKTRRFYTLEDALLFVQDHGTVVGAASDYVVDGMVGQTQGVLLADGAIFVLKAYCEGPLSDTTPDCQYGVELYGITP